MTNAVATRAAIRGSETGAVCARHEAHERLHPGITNPNWLILRARRQIFTRWARGVPGDCLRILDVGGRLQPYRPIFESRIREYYSVDIAAGECVQVRGRAEELPLASESFDVVICTQMLEYVPYPQRAIDEMHRVLRRDGHLFLSTPAVFPRDSDPEYWRFLPSALRLLAKNFSSVEIMAEGNSLTGLLRTINVCAIGFSPRIMRPLVRCTLTPGLNVLGAALERLIRTHNDQFTANYSVLARK